MKKSIIPLLAGFFLSTVLAGEISAVKPLGDKENRGGVTNNFTMAGWVQADVAVRLTPPATRGISATQGQKYILFPDPGHKQYGDGHSGSGLSIGTNGVMVIEHSSEYFSPVLTWTHPVEGRTHVAVVYRDGIPTLFINGEKTVTGIASGRIVHPGALKAGPPNDRFTGEMTGWAFYARALDDEQVKHQAKPLPVQVKPVQARMVPRNSAVKIIPPSGGDIFSDAFLNPADSTRPGVYWYWLGGIISKEGITKDLEAMKRVGIGRAYIGNITSPMDGLVSVKMFSDEWWELTRHAIREGGRLGVDIGIFNCPGWSQSGGPWVKPEQSMRYLAVSETKVSGPGKFSAVLPVPAQPFQDVALLAVPEAPQDPAAAILAKSQVTTSPAADGASLMFDGNLGTVCTFPADAGTKQPFFVEINCHQDVTARSITIAPDRVQLKVECELQYKDPAGKYQSVKKFTMERLNKDSVGPMLFAPVTEAFPAVTAKEFRLIFTRLLTGAKAAGQKPGIAEIALSGTPKLERYVEKQLGQSFPSPHTKWDAYLWKPQAASDEETHAVRSSQIQNISAFMDSSGKLTWDVPEGSWTVLRVGMVPTGVQNNSAPKEGKGMETDKMSAVHLNAHFEAYLGKLAEMLSPEERKGWKYVVADSYEKGPQNWTDNLQDEFRARYHYDPLLWLPVLTGRVAGSPDQSDRFLWDLRRLVADKVASDYARPLREASNKLGLKLWMENYGHFGFPGEDLQYGGQADEVAGEFWAAGELGSFEVRIASSAAHIYGKPVVSAESFTYGQTPWTQTPWSLKQRGDWAIAEGVNQYILHLFIHQPIDRAPGISAWFGTEFNRNNTWFNDMDSWIASFRRTQAVLQQGSYVADLAYFTGEDAPKETGICEPALPPGYNYDFMNGEVILRDLQVKDGRFVLPDGMSYRLLVLPPLETMRPALLQKISELVHAGGAILGEPPSRSPSLENYPQCDEQVRKLAGEVWRGIDGKTVTAGHYGKGFVFRGTDAATVLNALSTSPDIDGIGERASLGKGEGFAWIHRRTENVDVYFLANQSDEQKLLSLSFRVSDGVPELWDPVTGEMRALPQFTREAGRIQVPLEFSPRQSYLIAFRKTGAVPAGSVNFPKFESVLNLNSAWEVTFDPKWGGPGQVTFDQLTDWTKNADDGIKYYSGTAVYRYRFNSDLPVGGRFFLNLGSYNTIARVKLNGRDLGAVWVLPGRIEITDALKQGANELEIDVVNNWNNRLLGDSKLPVEKRTTWTSVDSGIKPGTQLISSGLMGPVIIEQLQP
jgi:hypothetical protein